MPLLLSEKKKKQTKVEATEVASLLLLNHPTPSDYDAISIYNFEIVSSLFKIPM